MADSVEATASIFEETDPPIPPKSDVQPKAESPTASKPPKPKLIPDAPTARHEQEEEKKDSLPPTQHSPSPHSHPSIFEYPPNSLSDAKAKYMKHKHRDSHKYIDGSPRDTKKGNITQLTNKVTQIVNDQIDQIQETTDKLLLAADDHISSLSKSTGIAFAPISIPLKRRRQTFAVLMWSLLYPIALLLNFVAFRYWTGWKFYAYLMYLAWKLMYQSFHRDGGLPIPWFRNAFFWKWFTDFFPIVVHKTYDLDDSGETSYLFGYHPHGIIGMGAVGTFAMMTSGFHRLFPGVDVRILTLKINFFVPFFDLIITFLGFCDASRGSCNAILSDPEHKSLCLVLGGAKESLEANPGKVMLYLKDRKGFVKVALENGASLVPVFGFGENELFEQMHNPQGSLVRKIQNQLQKRMGFALPLFRGRGIFQYDYGLLPKRIAIDVVFGKPIKCPKMTKEMITVDIIDKYHSIYIHELKQLFDDNKERYYPKDKQPEMHFF